MSVADDFDKTQPTEKSLTYLKLMVSYVLSKEAQPNQVVKHEMKALLLI